MDSQTWPELPLAEWKETYETLRRWAQVVGKLPLKLHPYMNHWWQVALHVTPRGLATLNIPYEERMFQVEFDFLVHEVRILTSDGDTRAMGLVPRSVAEFYLLFMGMMNELGLHTEINTTPKEIADPIPFEEDQIHRSYDPEYANRHWRILLQASRVLQEYRGRFIGKSSPVHFFWGSFDLAVTRFSGRRAPSRLGADTITREGYSHENISIGFWPGGGNIEGPAFYGYAAPEPTGFQKARIQPPQAFYNEPTHGYVLMYDEVRRARDPDQMILDFAQSVYEAGAGLANWDRSSLEHHLWLPQDLKPAA
jgi:hypothetical protein